MEQRGFTLIELLVFVAIFTIAIGGFITIFIAVTRVQSRQSSASEVETQGQFLLQQFQYYAQNARLVDMDQDAATGTLTLGETDPSQSPTTIYASSGVMYVKQGTGGTAQALTSDKVAASDLSFTRHFSLATSSAYGADSVTYDFTLSTANVSSGNPQYYSQSFQSSAALLAPVPKIALVQQATGENNNASVSSVNASYAVANATGSLLIAVTSNVGTAATAVSLSDTAGNSWTMVASTSYPAYNQKTVIYAASNSKNSTNTVTAQFGTSVNYPTLFLYEYRGAATSSPFDVSATQNITSTSSPSSGLASPSSGAELLFSVMYSNPATEIPAAGTGFTLETTSSVSATYVEDRNIYVTGPVSADWTYSVTAPDSSVVLATFK